MASKFEQAAESTSATAGSDGGGSTDRGSAKVMPGHTQAHINTFWGTIAAGYEDHSGNVAAYGSAGYQAWVEALAAALPDPPSDVLDVGSGTGYLALAAANLGHRVTAVDLAPAMLDELIANAATRGVAVDARLGDAVAPGFSPASFDVVASRHVLWTLREPARAMTNWRELLRPGGRLVAVDGFWFTQWEDDTPPLFVEHYTAETRGDLPLMHLDRPEPILGLLTAAGFVDVTAEPRPDLELGGGVPYLISATKPRVE
jgi:SAM-dependent methyltransferase